MGILGVWSSDWNNRISYSPGLGRNRNRQESQNIPTGSSILFNLLNSLDFGYHFRLDTLDLVLLVYPACPKRGEGMG